MLSDICMAVTMPGRYPEDSNIIDFVEVKMLALAEDYAASGRVDLAEAVWNALDNYMDGNIDIIFKKGDPYVTAIEMADISPSEKNE